jgi:hypothetical protein
MGDEAGSMTLEAGSATLNAWVGPDASYRWEDGSSDPRRTVYQPGTYQVQITREGFTIQGEIEVSATTRTTPTLETMGFAVYPNPTADWLYLENDQARKGTIEILDLQGKTIRRFASIPSEITVSDLPSGRFFIKINTQGQSLSGSFVVE